MDKKKELRVKKNNNNCKLVIGICLFSLIILSFLILFGSKNIFLSSSENSAKYKGVSTIYGDVNLDGKVVKVDETILSSYVKERGKALTLPYLS